MPSFVTPRARVILILLCSLSPILPRPVGGERTSRSKPRKKRGKRSQSAPSRERMIQGRDCGVARVLPTSRGTPSRMLRARFCRHTSRPTFLCLALFRGNPVQHNWFRRLFRGNPVQSQKPKEASRRNLCLLLSPGRPPTLGRIIIQAVGAPLLLVLCRTLRGNPLRLANSRLRLKLLKREMITCSTKESFATTGLPSRKRSRAALEGEV